MIIFGCAKNENNDAQKVVNGIDAKAEECAQRAANKYMYLLNWQELAPASSQYCSDFIQFAASTSENLTMQPYGYWYPFFSNVIGNKAIQYAQRNSEKIRIAREQIASSRRCVSMAASNKDNVLKKISKAYPNASNKDKIGMIVVGCIRVSGVDKTLDFQGTESEYFEDLYSALYSEAKENIMNFPQ